MCSGRFLIEGAGELVVEQRVGYQLWTLNRPAKRNALSAAQLVRLDEAVALADERACAAVVITGAPSDGSFCSGFDLADLASIARGLSEGGEPQTPIHATFDRLERASFAIVTAINGAAVGAGCELALLGDVWIAKRNATFSLPPAKLGVSYPAAGVRRMRDALGPSLLRAMLETALPVGADRLASAGILWSLEDDPVAAACAAAERIATLSSVTRRAHRDAMRALREP